MKHMLKAPMLLHIKWKLMIPCLPPLSFKTIALKEEKLIFCSSKNFSTFDLINGRKKFFSYSTTHYAALDVVLEQSISAQYTQIQKPKAQTTAPLTHLRWGGNKPKIETGDLNTALCLMLKFLTLFLVFLGVHPTQLSRRFSRKAKIS